MKEKFGDLIKRYRGQRSLQNLASEIGISAAYLCDIEKGYRYPSKNIIDKMIICFNLSENQKNFLYDLIAKESNNKYKVSEDIAEYIMKNELLREIIRKAKKQNLGKEYWKSITEQI